MMKSATISLEAIKLQLIQNTQFAEQRDKEFPISKEAIKYLIKALEHADSAFSQEIETVLTKSGEIAIPALLKGLCSTSNNVRSTCAMVLIRLGERSVEPVQQFYHRYHHRENLRWVAEFILDELSVPMPRVCGMVDATTEIPVELCTPELEKVG
jgi:HEAT repeat protein